MSARGRVAHLTSVHPPYDRRICMQCATLAEAGWQVSLVAKDGEFAVPGVKHLTIPAAPSRLHRTFLSSWHVFRLARKSGASICHFHDPELVPVGMLLSLMGRKVIYDVHEDMPLQILNKLWLVPWLRWPMARLTALAEWIATRLFFAGVVPATPPIARRFALPSAVTVQNFPELDPPDDVPPALPLKERADCAAYIGIIDENRGAAEIVRALDLCKNTSVKLILGGHFFARKVEEECRAQPAWSRVDFRGWLHHDGVQQALSEAKVGLVTLAPIPNYMEAYPTKLFSYMAAGIPVVASDFPLWRSIIDGAGCGLLVDPLKPQEIAEAIDWLIDHPDEATRMGANGKRAAHETYNWPTEAGKLVAFYESLET